MSSITTTELAEYVVTEIASGESMREVSSKVAAYLIDERKTTELPKVMRAIEEELARKGSTQVVVTSAREVSSEIKMQLAEMLNAQNPVFTEIIDKNVIGGVKARSGEQEIDLTVRGRLNRFKAKVVN